VETLKIQMLRNTNTGQCPKYNCKYGLKENWLKLNLKNLVKEYKIL
jgi:hypothetical protein